MSTIAPKTAVILAGAVAKGAFQAGVLAELARAPLDIVRIVATSAGALNGAVFATGLRHRRTELAAREITRTWLEEARWGNVLRFTLAPGGVCSVEAMYEVLERAMDCVAGAGLAGGAPAPDVTLQMVAAPLRGKANERGPRATIEGATTFEHVMAFAGASFDHDAGRREVIQAAAASAAFPLLFAPVDLPEVGPCVDGGAVNNTPVSYALEAPDVGRVIVVTDNPLALSSEVSLFMPALVGRLVDMLINERLFRDLVQTAKNNDKLDRLRQLADEWKLSPERRAQLFDTVGWRTVEVVQIRPEKSLEGSPFSGLARPKRRAAYVEQGRIAAARELAKLTY